MKKCLVIFVSLFIGLISVNAGSYTGWEHIEVSTLPDASVDTIGSIYDVNGKYYVSELVSSDNQTYQVNDVLKNNDSLIFQDDNLKVNVINYLVDNNCIEQYSSCKLFNYSGRYNYYFGLYYLESDIRYYYYDQTGTSAYIGSLNFTNETSFIYKLYYIKNSDSYPAVITKIYDNYLTSIMFKSLGAVKYEWKEISYSDWFEFDINSNDYYLFYSFTDISNFDVFNWVDFTSFTDFEKVCTVCLINILYSIVWLLVIYVFLKAFNKLISWCFR